MHQSLPFDRQEVAPLILTALLDAQSAQTLEALRARYFPAALNRVPAHLTLFHHLPGEDLRAISERVAALCGEHRALPFGIGGTRFLGRGVAFEVTCPPLVVLREALASDWRDRLTAQDRQGYRPHVTIQNKVTPAEARITQERLMDVLPIAGELRGLRLWHYRGGPWDEAGRYGFAA